VLWHLFCKKVFKDKVGERKNDKNLRLVFFKWNYGMISNYKRVKKHFAKRNRKTRILFKFPQTVMFLSRVWVGETKKLPLINVVDTSLNIKKGFYLVNANQKSLKSLLFFVRLLIKDKIIICRLQKLFFKKLMYNVL